MKAIRILFVLLLPFLCLRKTNAQTKNKLKQNIHSRAPQNASKWELDGSWIAEVGTFIFSVYDPSSTCKVNSQQKVKVPIQFTPNGTNGQFNTIRLSGQGTLVGYGAITGDKFHSTQEAGYNMNLIWDGNVEYKTDGNGLRYISQISGTETCGGASLPFTIRHIFTDKIDLSGVWSANHYQCPAGTLHDDEEVKIVQNGSAFTATKIKGDDCVPAGNITFRGNIEPTSNIYNITWTTGLPDRQACCTATGKLMVVDENTLQSVRDDGVEDVVFTREETHNCPVFKEMIVSAKELSSIANKFEKDDIFYYSNVIDMISRGYNSPYAGLCLSIPADDIPTYFKDENSIKAQRSQLVANIRTKAANRERFAEIGISGEYMPNIYSKETVMTFCSLAPEKFTPEFWDALWMAGYINYDLYSEVENYLIAYGYNNYFQILSNMNLVLGAGQIIAKGVARFTVKETTKRFAISEVSFVGLGSILKSNVPNVLPSKIRWEVVSGIVRDASIRKGNFGLGKASFDEAIEAGRSWLGKGFRLSKDGKAFVSKDELRIFRPPTFKSQLEKTQANLEWKLVKGGNAQGNGHIDIISP